MSDTEQLSSIHECDKPFARLYNSAAQPDRAWHDGPGWYYTDAEYEDEGCCGAFATKEEAIAHAEEAGYRIDNPEEK